MPVQLPFLFAEAMSFIHKWEVRRSKTSRIGVFSSCCRGARAAVWLQGRLFTNEQGVLSFSTRWNFEDGNVILRAIFKFSGTDLQYWE